MLKRFLYMVAFVVLCYSPALAQFPVNMETVRNSVVFLYRADASGKYPSTPLGTGFLVDIPLQHDPAHAYRLLVSARHVIDPVWACQPEPIPTRVFIRLNTINFDSTRDDTGVAFIPLDLVRNGKSPNVFTSADDSVDATVVVVNSLVDREKFDFSSILISDFATSEELTKLSEGYEIISAGLLPSFIGVRRNYPIFKFGHISSIPRERILHTCQAGQPKPLWSWLVAANLVSGNSGSPIVLSPPLFSNQRAILIGLQSVSFDGADLAGMTPEKYIFEIINSIGLQDANLYRGKVEGKKPEDKKPEDKKP